MRSVTTTVTVAAALWLGAAAAQACTPPNGCEGAVVFPVGAPMPSTATGIEWWSPGRMLPTAGVRLELRGAGGAWAEVPADATAGAAAAQVTLRPRAGFAANARYRVTTASDCLRMAAGDPKEFDTGAAAPLPTTLGTLTATAPERADIQQRQFVGGQCAYPASAVVSYVRVALSAEATPWASMLVYEALVDGMPFIGLADRGYPLVQVAPGSTHQGRGVARLAAICGVASDGGSPEQVTPGDGVSEGEHSVVFRARIAGTTTVLETAPVRVTLRCTPGAPTDAGVADAGAADSGVGATDAGATDAGTADAGAGGRVLMSGGCSVGARGAGGAYGAWALGGAVLGLVRRRRRAGSPRG
jgi:MYXO-CTERM domain-containing protein